MTESRHHIDRSGHGDHCKCFYCVQAARDARQDAHHEEHHMPPAAAKEVAAAQRKGRPIGTGVLGYFPKALAEVARVSKIGNDQHNPGEPLHWARDKSTDEVDALVRHLTDYLRGENYDTDGALHLGKVAWRALALLERWLDGEEPGR